MIPLAITAGLYALTTLLYLRYLLRFRQEVSRLASRALEVSFLVHAVALAFWVGELGSERLTHLSAVLPVAIWLVVAGQLIIEARFGLHLLGLLITPLVTIGLLFALRAAPSLAAMPVPVRSALLSIHVLGALLGVGAFCLAASLSALYLLQERQLKRKSFGPLYRRLPDLHTLDQLTYRLITIGLPIYTIALVLGAVRAHQGQGFGTMGRAYLLAVAAWVLFGLVLQGRLLIGWRGRRAAMLVLGGFAASALVLLHLLAI